MRTLHIYLGGSAKSNTDFFEIDGLTVRFKAHYSRQFTGIKMDHYTEEVQQEYLCYIYYIAVYMFQNYLESYKKKISIIGCARDSN